jgi:hypothetical protein
MGISKFRNRAAAGTLALTAFAILGGCGPYGGDPPTMPATDWNPGGGNQTQTPSGISLGGTIWNHKLPATPTLDPNSSAIVANTFAQAPVQGAAIASSGTSDWASAYYYAKSSDPTFRIHCWRYSCPLIEGVTIHIPANARPAQSTDGHMSVVDQTTGVEYNFSRALTTSSQTRPNGQTVGQYATNGVISVAAGGKGLVWLGDGRDTGCSTAGCFGLSFGVIRPQEITDGLIDHTMLTTLACAGVGGVFPAQNHNASLCSNTTNQPKMGTRFWLDYTDAQIDAIAGLYPWQRTYLKALHNYGEYASDTGGSNGALNVSVEGTEDYRVYGLADPWAQIAASTPGVLTWTSSGNPHYEFDFLRGVPNLQAHLHVLAPCVSQGTC